MESTQFRLLVRDDPFLKQTSCHIINEDELPSIIQRGHLYFVFIPNGKEKETDNRIYVLGHWTMIDFVYDLNGRTGSVNYFDPMGARCSAKTWAKLRNTAKYFRVKTFVNTTCVQKTKYASVCGPITAYFALLRARHFTYKTILSRKISRNFKRNVMIIPDIIASLLPKGSRNLPRFSLDFL